MKHYTSAPQVILRVVQKRSYRVVPGPSRFFRSCRFRSAILVFSSVIIIKREQVIGFAGVPQLMKQFYEPANGTDSRRTLPGSIVHQLVARKAVCVELFWKDFAAAKEPLKARIDGDS